MTDEPNHWDRKDTPTKRQPNRQLRDAQILLSGPLSVEDAAAARLWMSAETDEVRTYLDTIKNLVPDQIVERLCATNNIDEARACIILLHNEGRLDLKDHAIWETLNRLMRANFSEKDCRKYLIDIEKERNGFGDTGERVMTRAIEILWDGIEEEWARVPTRPVGVGRDEQPTLNAPAVSAAIATGREDTHDEIDAEIEGILDALEPTVENPQLPKNPGGGGIIKHA
jgi:hypothetical protein